MDDLPLENKFSYQGDDLEALDVLHNYRSWIIDCCKPYLRGKTLEIGAGIGSFSCDLSCYGKSLDALEPDPNQFNKLHNATNSLAKISAHNQSIELFLHKNDNKYDSIVMINVLEHIEDDHAIVRKLYDLLEPGGHLIIFVPALQFLYSKLDKIVGHYRRYEKNTLTATFADTNFRCLEINYFDSFGILPWLLINRIMGSTSFSKTMAIIYDRLIVPPLRSIERYFSPIRGKNLFLVLNKPIDDIQPS